MNLFDILGPVMVGPSSSHTAGAVRLGRTARRLLGEGTPRERRSRYSALCRNRPRTRHRPRAIAGLWAFSRMTSVSPEALTSPATQAWRSPSPSPRGREHPNTARIDLVGQSGKTLSMTGSSLGGGRIMVVEMNGLRANFSGDLPTLIVQNVDQPGHVSEVTSMLAHKGVNIATMQLYRDHPGGNAVMIIETDKAVPPEGIAWLERSEGITRVTFIDAEREA
ncbi:MAG: ACT domain-containing protein [Christensenellales bacterium]